MSFYPNYSNLTVLLTRMLSKKEEFEQEIIPYLIDAWLSHYSKTTPKHEIVEVNQDSFSYLFDIENSRLIAAWGMSQGHSTVPRDRARMKGHPLGGNRTHYHRGHAIPHSLGGGLDINLVTQRGSLNIGQFRSLERRAVATPGSLYFTYWVYGSPQIQKPIKVEQGLLFFKEISGKKLPDINISQFNN